MIRKIQFIFFAFMTLCSSAQISHLVENVQYSFSAQGTAGAGDNAPFWFTNNRYGLGTTDNFSGLARVALWRTVETDSLWFWRVGYGVDLVAPINSENGYFNVQQAYADIEWKMLRLSIGQKERPSELKNPLLSTGGMTMGINARPIPQIRAEMPYFWTVPGTKGLFAFKGHIAYGLYTDSKWQKKFNSGTNNIYTANSKFHSKALFVRIGNHECFPLEFTGGLEMVCQFGGRGWNILPYVGDTPLQDVPLGGNVFTSLIPGGGDVNDENFTNAAGNHLGSWHLRFDWKQKGWSAGVYLEHFFEDHSQMFMQYGMWKDMLLGLEVNFPKNRFLSSLVYEYNHTMHQSGAIYHDWTQEIPVQVSARDDYYNNHVYGSWQMGGFVLGNPLIISPIYNPYFNNTGSLAIRHNRFKVHHIGLSGSPFDELCWCILYTHQYSLGTFNLPMPTPNKANYLLVEATYAPSRLNGLSLTASYGHNDGNLLGNSNAAMLTVRFDGWLNRTQW